MLYSIKYYPGFIAFLLLIILGCGDDDPVGPDPDPEGHISFRNHVIPIFQQHGCIGCHGPGIPESNLRVDSVEGLLAGGNSGEPAVIPGNADGSMLIRQMSPNPPLGNRMPIGMSPVPDNQQNTIRRWINEGALDN
jgi:hypothetical protein